MWSFTVYVKKFKAKMFSNLVTAEHNKKPCNLRET